MHKSPPVKEGFADRAALTDTLHYNVYAPGIDISAGDMTGGQATNTTYRIFDPSAAYLQADIYAMEYAIPLTNLANSERTITNNILDMTEKSISVYGPNNCNGSVGADPGFTRADFIYSAYNEPTEITYDTYRNICNYTAKDGNNTNIKSFYIARDKNFMTNYNFTSRFINNPIGFILSGAKPNNSYINCGIDVVGRGEAPTFFSQVQGYIDMTYNYTTTPYNISMSPTSIKTISKGSTVGSFRDYMISQYFFNQDGGVNKEGRRGAIWGQAYDNSCRNPGWSSTLFNIYNKGTPRGSSTRICANIPGEKASVYASSNAIDGPGIATNLILNPEAWTLKSFMTTPSPSVLALINDFVQTKGMRARGDADYSTSGSNAQLDNYIPIMNARISPLMYNNLVVTGTISDTNKREIRKSVYYSMYFNFTDTSTVFKQICVGSDLPCNLYMFPDCSGMDEFKSFRGIISIDKKAVEHNNNSRRVLITDDILKVLPYHTRNFIRRWAISRRTAIQKWISRQCVSFTAGADYSQTMTYIRTEDNVKSIENYCCADITDATKVPNWAWLSGTTTGAMQNNFQAYSASNPWIIQSQTGTGSIPTTPIKFMDTIYNFNNRDHNAGLIYDRYNQNIVTLKITNGSCATKPVINSRNYAEAKGDPNNTVLNADIAPLLNLMSTPLQSPNVYIAKTANKFTPVFNLVIPPNAISGSGGTQALLNEYLYTITLQIDTTNPASLTFLKTSNIYVTVACLNYADKENSFEAVIDSYENGMLRLKNISPSGVIVNDIVQSSSNSLITWSPALKNDFYSISYTDMTSLNQGMKTANIITAIVLNPLPIAGGTTTLNIPSVNPPTFSVNENVYITDTSNTKNYFSAKVSAVDSTTTPLYTKITVNTISNIGPNASFADATIYSIVAATTTGSRFWLTAQEKQQTLNMIAQKYYELNNGAKKIQTIFDVYQIGDTIFDVRFLEYERDPIRTQAIQTKMAALNTDYTNYRTYNLSADQLAQLDLSYTTDMIELNNQLDNAIKGIAYNCGIQARYVKIRRTDTSTGSSPPADTDTGGIQLSQVIIIDNTGNNVAYNALVTPTSTYVYNFESTSDYSYISPPNSKIASDGSIRNSVDVVLAQAGTCTPLTQNANTYTSPNCITDQDGSVSVKKVTDSTGDNASKKAIKLRRNQSIVDGNVRKQINGKYNTRVIPYFFRSGFISTNESITIDLAFLTDIVKISLVFPKAYNQAATYEISFMDSSQQIINTSKTSTTPLIKTGSINATTDFLDFNCLIENRDLDLPTCPTDLLNPYKVARFYANFSNKTDGNPTANLEALQFTGYTIGTDAALTFNPMYNAGFVLNTASGSGNINYNPRTNYTYDSTPRPDAGIIDCTDPKRLKNILRDYAANISNYKFANRVDIQSLSDANVYDNINYVYNPIEILRSRKLSDGVCRIKWKENVRNRITNVKNATPITRYGDFVYLKNTMNWGANDIYYDIKNSKIYSSDPDTNLPDLSAPINMPDILPQEDTLDTTGGRCPEAKCSDINVIKQLVQGFNDLSGSVHGTSILRVTKAVTVTPNQCQFEVYQQGKTTAQKITMNLNVDYSTSPAVNVLTSPTTICKYTWDGSDPFDETAEYIQPNTPTLAYVYNYVTELMQPYVDTLTNTITGVAPNLSRLVQKTTAANDYSTYIKDTYGAYGQIKELSGCSALDISAGRAQCGSRAISNEFIKAYNTANRGSSIISNITRYGTASNTECDYLVSVAPVETITHGTTRLTTTLGQSVTRLIRAVMKKSVEACDFSVDNTQSTAPYINGLKPIELNNITDSTIKSLKPVALNQTAWTTPITLGTQTISQTLAEAGSILSLNVPPSNSYIIGTSVSVIDTANVNNSFTASISYYTAGTPLSTLGLNNVVRNANARFGSPTKYTIRANPPETPIISGQNPVETVDYVDCSSPFVAQILSIGSTTNARNVNATTCLVNGIQYRFRSPNSTTNSLTLAEPTSGIAQLTTNDKITSDGPTMNAPPATITSTLAQSLYPNIITSVNAISAIGYTDIWDFRVSESDTLPFGDTYKRIRFYNDNSVPQRLRIRLVEDAPINISGFAFFRNNTPTVDLINLCASAARDWWNTRYAKATETQEKIIIGNITGWNLDTSSDAMIFSATACNYGIHGHNDIRRDPSTRYFQAVYRQKYKNPNLGANYILGSSAPPGIQIWLDGADPNGNGTTPPSNITTWKDKSGNNKDGTLRNNGTVTYNSKYGLLFNQTGWFQLPDGSIPFNNTSYTIYFVATFDPNLTPGKTHSCVFSAGGGANYTVYSGNLDVISNNYPVGITRAPNTQAVYSLTLSSSGSTYSYVVRVNGVFAAESSPGARNQGAGGNYVGYVTPSMIMNGYIAEFLVYNQAHTNAQREVIESYLANKWNLNITYTRGSLTNNLIVISMTETTAPTSITPLATVNAYVALPEDIKYNLSLSLQAALQASHEFRFLRFKVTETPESSSSSEKAAEILQMNFYKKTITSVNSKRLEFKYGTYSLEGLKTPRYNVYNTINSTGTASITPVNNGFVEITVPQVNPNFSVNNNVIVYNALTPANYFTGTITTITPITPTDPTNPTNRIRIANITSLTGNFTSAATTYTIAKNMCDTDYNISSDITRTSYHICNYANINSPPYTYEMKATTITLTNGTYPLPCAIGYRKKENTTNMCVTTGIFSDAINIPVNRNMGQPRLQLNKDQYFYINLNETVNIDYFNFITGVSNTRPTQWILEGSMCGINEARYWIPIHIQNSTYTYAIEATTFSGVELSIKTPNGNTIYSFVETNYFPFIASPQLPVISNINKTGNTYNVVYDPSISIVTPYLESFQNPTLLDIPVEGKQRRRVPKLETAFQLPLTQATPNLDTRMPILGARRIQYIRIKILKTQLETSKQVHMSNFQFITPVGPLPTKYYKITNPMGVHPTKYNGPDALMTPDKCWISLNKEPLLIKFSTLPGTIIQGFKFSASNTIQRALDSLPSEWRIEGSYDGRQWEVYHETEEPEVFTQYNSPVYSFRKEI